MIFGLMSTKEFFLRNFIIHYVYIVIKHSYSNVFEGVTNRDSHDGILFKAPLLVGVIIEKR